MAPSPIKFFPNELNNVKTDIHNININISFFNNNGSLSASNKYIKINIIKKFKELKLFTPSIKLKPLIKTKKKNDIINGFRKEFCIILFNQFILVSIVMSGVSDIKKNIINN